MTDTHNIMGMVMVEWWILFLYIIPFEFIYQGPSSQRSSLEPSTTTELNLPAEHPGNLGTFQQKKLGILKPRINPWNLLTFPWGGRGLAISR